MTTPYVDTHIKRLAIAREAAELGARKKAVAQLSCLPYRDVARLVPALLSLAERLSDHLPTLSVELAKRAKEIGPSLEGIDEFVQALEPRVEARIEPSLPGSGPTEVPDGVAEHMRRFDAAYQPDAHIATATSGRHLAFWSLFDQGQFDKALRVAEEWSRIPGAAFEAGVAKVRALLELQRFDEAEPAAQSLFDAHPEQVEAAEMLFEVYYARGQDQQALRFALMVAHSGESYARRGGYLASRAYRRLGASDKARTHAAAAFAGDFSNIPYVLNYIYVLRAIGQHGDDEAWVSADAVAGDALAANPDSSELLFCYAQALAHQERLDEAIEALQRVLQLDPRHPVAAKFIDAIQGKRPSQ